VSARQLLDQQFVGRFQQLLREHSLPAECIEIELTENVLQTGRSTNSNIRAFAIAESIVELGARLGLNMTVEGIERPEQLGMLWQHETLHLHGYLLSRPVSAEQLPDVIASLPMRMRSLLLSAPSRTQTSRAESARDATVQRESNGGSADRGRPRLGQST